MVLVDGLGNLIDFRLMPGQRHDSRGVMALLEGLSFAAFLGDKAFDNDKLRAELHQRRAKAVIPPRRNRKVAIDYDRDISMAPPGGELLRQDQRVQAHRHTLREDRCQLCSHDLPDQHHPGFALNVHRP
jgi:transposase